MKRLWLSVLAPCTIVASYVLSYAPALKVHDDGNLAIFRPVEWLVDNTPAEGPLRWWAGAWGVEFEYSARMVGRLLDRRKLSNEPPMHMPSKEEWKRITARGR